MPRPPQFLVVDGYPRASRDRFDAIGMRQAWKLYVDLVARHAPAARVDVWLSSEPGHETPPDNASLRRYDGVLWTGCDLTAYHDDPRVHRHVRLCARAFDLGVPQFGSCWALQIGALAAGGAVGPCPDGREVGIGRRLALTDAGRAHPMFAGRPPVFDALVIHDDMVTRLPPDCSVLASNAWSPVQAAEMRAGRGVFWAVQYHPEYNLYELARLIALNTERLVAQGYAADNAAVRRFIDTLDALHVAPTRKDLRWQLGVDEEIVNEGCREREFANWLRAFVRP